MRWGALLLVLVAACGGDPPAASPSPSTQPPSPAPSPDPIVFPLGVAGHNFVDAAGRPVVLRAVIECCWNKELSGWPGIYAAGVQEVAEYGANAVIIRIGPHSNRVGAPDAEAAPGTGWLAAQAQVCRLASSLGVICIVSVVDCWGIRTENNFYEWHWRILDFGPTREVEHWASIALRHFIGLDNVIFETGNECFEFPEPSRWQGSSVAWELGLRDLIRTYAGQDALVGTNTHRASIERAMDWVSLHQQ